MNSFFFRKTEKFKKKKKILQAPSHFSYLFLFIFSIHYFVCSPAHSISKPNAKIKKEWNHSAHLRKNKKIALGLGAASLFGLYGFSLELNLTNQKSFQIGFGNAPHYNTFHLQVVNTMLGKRFSPYFAGGYSIWYTGNQELDQLKKTTPSFLEKKFLQASDIEKGSFTEHIVYSSIGVQYLQIKPPWAGLALYGEANLLINIDDFIGAITGGIGIKYYF